MNKVWYFYLGWIAVAGVLGFAISAFFAGVLRLPRSVYLIPYIGLAGLFLYAYTRWSGLSIGNLLRHNWHWGLIGGLLFAVFTVKNVLSQRSLPGRKDFRWSLTSSGRESSTV